jgi:hypothetical protein
MANETCSRVATINYQEVLVDSSSTKKGEGLRFYLEKDPVAKQHLELYQKETGIRWQNAALGTAGTGLILSTAFMDDKNSNREVFLLSGLTLLTVNFLLAATMDYYNERNLHKAIEEYNKRNLPKINFNHSRPVKGRKAKYDVSVQKQWGF